MRTRYKESMIPVFENEISKAKKSDNNIDSFTLDFTETDIFLNNDRKNHHVKTFMGLLCCNYTYKGIPVILYDGVNNNNQINDTNTIRKMLRG